eukprot:364115-Chlamydomonas_euryale.AAC.2
MAQCCVRLSWWPSWERRQAQIPNFLKTRAAARGLRSLKLITSRAVARGLRTHSGFFESGQLCWGPQSRKLPRSRAAARGPPRLTQRRQRRAAAPAGLTAPPRHRT